MHRRDKLPLLNHMPLRMQIQRLCRLICLMLIHRMHMENRILKAIIR